MTRLTEAIDVAPTILERIGGVVPSAMDGRSLVPFLDGHDPGAWRTEVFFEHDFREVVTQAPETALGLDLGRMLLRGGPGRTLQVRPLCGVPPLLFDMRADPHETTNLAEEPAMQGVLLRYRAASDWRLTRADRTLTNMALTPEGLVERS